jgi:hypothetical protein
MDGRDLELRNLTYGLFVELGRAQPRTKELRGQLELVGDFWRLA